MKAFALLAFGLLASGCASPLPSSMTSPPPVATLSVAYGPMCTGVPLSEHVVLTATHCLGDGVLVDGAGYELLASDGNDHSLIRTEAKYLQTADVDTKAAAGAVLATGMNVVLYGHPEGIDLQMRRGYVTGTTATPDFADPVIDSPVAVLLDMPVRGGDSGGPLYDSKGDVVGSMSITSPVGGGIFPYAFTPDEWKLAE